MYTVYLFKETFMIHALGQLTQTMLMEHPTQPASDNWARKGANSSFKSTSTEDLAPVQPLLALVRLSS